MIPRARNTVVLRACLVLLAVSCACAMSYQPKPAMPQPEEETLTGSKLLDSYLFEGLRTIEVGVRGLLLGFGATILKDLLYLGKRTEQDRKETMKFAWLVGLGMACMLVGASVFVPKSWRSAAME